MAVLESCSFHQWTVSFSRPNVVPSVRREHPSQWLQTKMGLVKGQKRCSSTNIYRYLTNDRRFTMEDKQQIAYGLSILISITLNDLERP